MPNPSTVIRKTAENVIRLGTPATFSKSVYIDEIRKRAEEIRTPGESDAQAFTKAITADPVGVALYKASKHAEGPEIEGDAPQDELDRPKEFHEFGPAHAKVEALARTHALKNPSKSMEQSRAAVMNRRPDLTSAMQREHLAAITGRRQA